VTRKHQIHTEQQYIHAETDKEILADKYKISKSKTKTQSKLKMIGSCKGMNSMTPKEMEIMVGMNMVATIVISSYLYWPLSTMSIFFHFYLCDFLTNY
jgi:hypothetical protein